MQHPSPQLCQDDKFGMWMLVHGLRNLTPSDPLSAEESQIGNYAARYCLAENGWSKTIGDAVTFNDRDEAEQYRDRRSFAYWREREGKEPGEGVPWEPLPE